MMVVATKPEALLLAHRAADAEEHRRQAEAHAQRAAASVREAIEAIAEAHRQPIAAGSSARLTFANGAISGFEIIEATPPKAE